MKIYNRVKQILEQKVYSRNNDRYLMYMVWTEENPHIFQFIDGTPYMNMDDFIGGELTTTSTIKRARRKVQSDFPDLKATSEEVKKLRHQKEQTKGGFIYSDIWK